MDVDEKILQESIQAMVGKERKKNRGLLKKREQQLHT
jgi:hypothetical protein